MEIDIQGFIDTLNNLFEEDLTFEDRWKLYELYQDLQLLLKQLDNEL